MGNKHSKNKQQSKLPLKPGDEEEDSEYTYETIEVEEEYEDHFTIRNDDVLSNHFSSKITSWTVPTMQQKNELVKEIGFSLRFCSKILARNSTEEINLRLCDEDVLLYALDQGSSILSKPAIKSNIEEEQPQLMRFQTLGRLEPLEDQQSNPKISIDQTKIKEESGNSRNSSVVASSQSKTNTDISTPQKKPEFEESTIDRLKEPFTLLLQNAVDRILEGQKELALNKIREDKLCQTSTTMLRGSSQSIKNESSVKLSLSSSSNQPLRNLYEAEIEQVDSYEENEKEAFKFKLSEHQQNERCYRVQEELRDRYVSNRLFNSSRNNHQERILPGKMRGIQKIKFGAYKSTIHNSLSQKAKRIDQGHLSLLYGDRGVLMALKDIKQPKGEPPLKLVKFIDSRVIEDSIRDLCGQGSCHTKRHSNRRPPKVAGYISYQSPEKLPGKTYLLDDYSYQKVLRNPVQVTVKKGKSPYNKYVQRIRHSMNYASGSPSS